MSTISLQRIVEATQARVTAAQAERARLEAAAREAPPPPPWTAALMVGEEVAVIAEIKRRSPSAGAIAPIPHPADHAVSYLAGGARAVSVLTEPTFFGGSADDLAAVRAAVSAPVLRKDFIIDPVQLYETRAIGASCVLLIVRLLSDTLLDALSALAADLGLARLVEVHTEAELDRALRVAPESIGVNSRDLDTFQVDLARIEPILRRIPEHTLSVAESGIATRDDAERVATWGADAILVGTALAAEPQPATGVTKFTGIRRRDRNAAVEPTRGGRT